ncbi:MAG: ribose 5-phosphate isomerase B, partial [Nitrospirae bacterium]|nr:ribose 5-phosphate isomerase B [Nitrospirota bacterium]
MSRNRIAIGSDHAGLELKNFIKDILIQKGIEPVDFGTHEEASVDYPDFGEQVSFAVARGEVERGILICGTGLGMSIVANKFPGIRATLCHDEYTARMSRLHNDSNILVMGGRVIKREVALKVLLTWLETPFEGGRHSRRLDKILKIEKRF